MSKERKVIKLYIHKAYARFSHHGSTNREQSTIYLIGCSEKIERKVIRSSINTEDLAEELNWVFRSSFKTRIEENPSEIMNDNKEHVNVAFIDLRMEFGKEFKIESNEVWTHAHITETKVSNNSRINVTLQPNKTYCLIPMDKSDVQKFFDALFHFYSE